MNKEIVESALSKVIYPGFQKDILSFGFVDKIETDGSDVTVEITVTSSAKEVEDDLRTNIETSNTQSFLDGDIDKFLEASLKSGL